MSLTNPLTRAASAIVGASCGQVLPAKAVREHISKLLRADKEVAPEKRAHDEFFTGQLPVEQLLHLQAGV